VKPEPVLEQLLTIVGAQPATQSLHFAKPVAAVCKAVSALPQQGVKVHLPVGERKEVLVTVETEKEGPDTDHEALFPVMNVLREALLGASCTDGDKKNHIYLRGYMNHPSIFQPVKQSDVAEAGFEALCSYVPPEDVQMACWDMHQKGFCPRYMKKGGGCCRWRHPKETLKFRVVTTRQ